MVDVVRIATFGAELGVVETASIEDPVVLSLRKRFRRPPKKLDFFVVGTGVVVVAERTS